MNLPASDNANRSDRGDADDSLRLKQLNLPVLGILQRILLQGLGLGLWAAALFGTSQLHQIELPAVHSICGPWGCAAEPSALIGYHLFLLVLMAPIVVIGCHAIRQPIGSQLARWAFLGGLIGALGLMVWGAGGWFLEGRGGEHALQRGLFIVATTPDLPFLQLSLSGLLAMIFQRVTRKTASNQSKKQRPQVGPLNSEGGEATIVV